MRWQMRKCVKCASYGLSPKCRVCGGETVLPHPPKFSPDDRYLRMRFRRE
jgi:H/ACA ribonucleoprotein complex subunit 3